MAQSRLAAVQVEEVPLVGEERPAPVPSPRESMIPGALTGLLLTSLRALSQRTIVALASLTDLLLIASAFALWLFVISNPTTTQLVAVGGYALFILFALYMRRA